MGWKTRKKGSSSQKGKKFRTDKGGPKGLRSKSQSVHPSRDEAYNNHINREAKRNKSLRDATVYDGKPAPDNKVWIHEGYYIEEGTARKEAEKHHGCYKEIKSGLYEGSFEVFAPVSKLRVKLAKMKSNE